MDAFFRTGAAIAAGLVTLAGAHTAQADQKSPADDRFCADIAALDSDLMELNAIGPHSTVAELRAAINRVDDDNTEIRKAAGKMKTPTAKQFTGAIKQLDHDVNNIPSNATLEQVRTRIHDDGQNALAAGQQLAAESGCPQPSQQQTP